MLSPDPTVKVSKRSSPTKKEKSHKKRKSEALEEQQSSEAIPEVVTTTIDDVEEVEPAVKVSKRSSSSKKEKSHKKRKADALEEHQSSEAIPKVAAATIGDVEEVDGKELPDSPAPKKRKLSVEEIEVDVTLPEPPSRKALRRLKKGKPLPPSKSGAESESEAKLAKKPEVEKRSEHGIWIGNLPWHVSKADLRKFLVDNSDLTDETITRVHMPGPNDSKPANKVEETKKFARPIHNKGFAYVDLSTADAVSQAVELSEQLLSGRRVLIKDNKSFEGRPQKTKEESRNDGKPPSTKVFLGNLSFDTTEESLKEHFDKCGALASVKVATFEDSGKCKGYAWIEFEELSAAESAVRGFVMIEADDAPASEDEGSSDASEPKTRKVKMRKWWVNKIKGRPLRMEFAEGAQVRYKKRYGKEGTKSIGDDARPARGETKGIENTRHVSKKIEYRQEYAPRLTGGIVESKGTKVTF